MLWTNYFKKRKEAREQARIAAEKKAAETRAHIIRLTEKEIAIEQQSYMHARKEEDKRNGKCPKCGSIHVNDRVKQQHGSIKGDFSGSGWNALTFGEHQSSGSIRGKFDTKEINKCNDCQHEWKKHEALRSRNILSDNVESIASLFSKYYEAANCEFDPLDVTEKYSSLEDKRAALKKNADEDWRHSGLREFWAGTSSDAVRVLARKYLYSFSYERFEKQWNPELLQSLGIFVSE